MRKICQDCGFIGKEKKIVPGSLGSEIGLWFFGLLFCLLLFPLGAIILLIAFLYSLWRLFATRKRCCPKCKHENCMIPQDSPAGQTLMQQFEQFSKSKKDNL